MPKYTFCVFRKSITKLIYLIFFSCYRKPMYCRYVLQRRQGHDSGFHSLITTLKLSLNSLFLKLF